MNDLIVEVRSEIEGIMETLYQKKSSTEFVGRNFSLINRLGDIGVIYNQSDDEETSLDDIEDEPEDEPEEEDEYIEEEDEEQEEES